MVSRLYRIKVDVAVSKKSNGEYATIEDIMSRVKVKGSDVVNFMVTKVYMMPDEALHIKKSLILDKVRGLLGKPGAKLLKKDLLDLFKKMKDVMKGE